MEASSYGHGCCCLMGGISALTAFGLSSIPRTCFLIKIMDRDYILWNIVLGLKYNYRLLISLYYVVVVFVLSLFTFESSPIT